MKRGICFVLMFASVCVLFAGGRMDQAASDGGRPGAAVKFTPKTEIQKYPEIASLYGKLDLSDPYKTVVSGLYRQEAKVKSETRPFLVYISPANRQAESYVCLIPDSKQDPLEVFESHGWKEIADAEGLVLVIMESRNGTWDLENDMAYLNAMYSQSRLRQWYNVQKGNSYLLGYGDGANLAQAWATRAPANFASVATFGPVSLTADYLAASAAVKTESPLVKNSEIPVPMWMFIESLGSAEKTVFDYWKAANKADTSQVFKNADITEMYLARPSALSTLVDEQDYVAQTRLTVASDVRAAIPGRTRKVWSFLSSVTRTGGIINCDLRPAYTLKDWNAAKRTLQIDGVVRHWYEFVPAQFHNSVDGKVPLVVAMHGQSTTADSFLWRSEWIKLAAERGFIVVFPAAALSGKNDKAMPRPNWNITADKECFDDYKFLRSMITELSARLPVDASRVYATGQSMGFMTSLAIAIELDDIITAIAGETGFLLTDKDGNPFYTSDKAKTGRKMPMFVIIGEKDMPDFLAEPTKKLNMGYWINRNGTGNYEKPFGTYADGRYRITTWADKNNVPLVQYALQLERPHAPIPSDNTMLYDGFLSKWNKGANGTLYYMGAEVK